MALEPSFANIDDLNPSNPEQQDPLSESSNHHRGIKQALKANVSGSALQTALRVNGVDRFTVTDFAALLKSNQAVAAAAQLGVLGGMGVVLYVNSTGIQLGVRTTDEVGDLGPWLIFADGTQEVDISLVGDVASVFNRLGGDGIGLMADDTPELVLTASDGSVTLRGVGVADTGLNSSGTVRDAANDVRPIGLGVLPQSIVTGADTLLDTDNQKRIKLNGTAAFNLATDAALSEGWTVLVTNGGTDPVTITHGGTTQIYSGDDVLTGDAVIARGGVATLTMAAGNVLEVWGGGVAPA